jgi:hypothetical protein
MFRNLTARDHEVILEHAKKAWQEWYLKGIRPDTMIPQDTLEFWTILETEKLIRQLIAEEYANELASNSPR